MMYPLGSFARVIVFFGGVMLSCFFSALCSYDKIFKAGIISCFHPFYKVPLAGNGFFLKMLATGLTG